MKKPKIRLTLIDRKGAHPCHRGQPLRTVPGLGPRRGTDNAVVD